MRIRANYYRASAETLKDIDRKTTEEIYKLTDAAPLDTVGDIDKAWDGLHFLMTGCAEPDDAAPLSLAVFGDKRIGDSKFVTLSCLTPAQVDAITDALECCNIGKALDGFSPESFYDADIYPNDIWQREDREELIEELRDAYDTLLDFYTSCRNNKCGAIVYLG